MAREIFFVMRYQTFDIGSPIFVFGNREIHAECSKRPFSKAAADESTGGVASGLR
jgi:hypothetical protein